MDRKKTFLAVFSIGIMVFSFLFLSSLESLGSYEKLQNQAAENSYQVNYSIEFPNNVTKEYNYSSFRLYSSGTIAKQVLPYKQNNTYLRNTSFISDNRTITCSNVERTIESSECSIDSPVNQFFYTLGKGAENYNLSETQTRNISGRECQGYEFEADQNIVPNGSELRFPAKVSMCIDKEEGYIAGMNITGTLDNSNLTTVNLVRIKAEEVDTDFNGNARPPFKTLVKAKCGLSEPVIELVALEEVGDFKVSLGGENITLSTTPYERLEVHIPEPLIKPGVNTFKVYTKEGSQTVNCSY